VATTTGTVERRRVRLTAGGALTIVGTIVGLVVLQRVFVAAHRPLSWAAATAATAVMLDPVVDWLARRIHRVPAVLLTLLVVAGITIGTAYLVFDEVQAAVDRLEAVAPTAAAEIESRDGRVGELAQDFQLTERVTSFVNALDDRVTGGDDVLRSTAGTAPTYLVGAILTIFFMTYGPRMAASALAQDPDEERRGRTKAIMGPAVRRARAAILLTVGDAIAFGVVGGLVAHALGLPAPTAVGFVVGLFALFPHIGIIVGAIPLLLLTLAFESGSWAIVLFAGAVLAQIADSTLLRPRIGRRSIEIGLLVPWVVGLIGYTVYGPGAAAFGTAYAILGLAILDGLQAANRFRSGMA
jgi:predicted PurR-regulated permease PerM